MKRSHITFWKQYYITFILMAESNTQLRLLLLKCTSSSEKQYLKHTFYMFYTNQNTLKVLGIYIIIFNNFLNERIMLFYVWATCD